MANPLPAWLYPISQQFGGGALGASEKGTDYATPFHTPIGAPFGGTIISESYGGYGGEVDIATSAPGAPFKTETLLHLDQIFAPKGAQVAAGQIVGLSGGQLSGGSHPASPLFSTGPHTEIDLWTGSPWKSASLNPDSILKKFGGYAGSVGPGIPNVPGAIGTGLADIAALENQALQQGVSSGLNAGLSAGFGLTALASSVNAIPTQVGHGLADFFSTTESNIAEWLKRQSVAFFVAAIVLLVLFA